MNLCKILGLKVKRFWSYDHLSTGSYRPSFLPTLFPPFSEVDIGKTVLFEHLKLFYPSDLYGNFLPLMYSFDAIHTFRFTGFQRREKRHLRKKCLIFELSSWQQYIDFDNTFFLLKYPVIELYIVWIWSLCYEYLQRNWRSKLKKKVKNRKNCPFSE